MTDDILKKAGDIIAGLTVHGGNGTKIPYCSLGMIDFDGGPTVSAITAATAGGIEWLTFCTGISSNKAKRLEADNRSSVCFCSENYNVTLTGFLQIITDQEVKKEMWYPPLSDHFSGTDDAEYCVLKFTTWSYNLLVDWRETRGRL